MMVTLSWSEIDALVALLAKPLREQRFDLIVGIARSGLIPSVMLSHSLGVREMGVLDVQRTDSDAINATKHVPECRGIMKEELMPGRHALLVDDIVGEGTTLACARELLSGLCASVTTAVLVVNEANLRGKDWRTRVDHVGCLVHGWVTFPWEGKPRTPPSLLEDPHA